MSTLPKYVISKVQSPLLISSMRRSDTRASKSSVRKRNTSPKTASKSPKHHKRHHKRHVIVAGGEYGFGKNSASNLGSPSRPTTVNYVFANPSKILIGPRSTSAFDHTNLTASGFYSPEKSVDLFRGKRLTISTDAENLRIKQKIAEYEATTRKKYFF